MLVHYGLLSRDELRPDFGGSGDVPDCDSDMEAEINRENTERDEMAEARKLGIEYKMKESEDGFEVEDIKYGD